MDVARLEAENAGVENAHVKVDDGDLHLQLVIRSTLFDSSRPLVPDHVRKSPGEVLTKVDDEWGYVGSRLMLCLACLELPCYATEECGCCCVGVCKLSKGSSRTYPP